MSHLNLARQAFNAGDANLSKKAHSEQRIYTEPGHQGNEGTYRKCAIYGGFEGLLISTVLLVILTSVQLAPALIFSYVLASLLILTIGFSLRDFTRYRADMLHYQREYARERWEMTNFPEGERQEIEQLYVSKYSFSDHDAKSVVNILAKYERFFVDLMMLQELQMLPPDSSPLLNALCTGGSFLIFGLLPLLFYLLQLISLPLSEAAGISFLVGHPLIAACIIAVIASIALFLINNKLLPNYNRAITHVQMFIILCLAASLAFYLPAAVSSAVHTCYSS